MTRWRGGTRCGGDTPVAVPGGAAGRSKRHRRLFRPDLRRAKLEKHFSGGEIGRAGIKNKREARVIIVIATRIPRYEMH